MGDNYNKTGKIYEIYNRSRQCGHTEWILNSAIENPNIIIVSPNQNCSNYLKRRYTELLMTKKYSKEIYNHSTWKFLRGNRKLKKKNPDPIMGEVIPKFMTIDSNFNGYRLPIIFDNSCFF